MRMRFALIPINDEQGILNFEIFLPFIIRHSLFDIQNSIPGLPGRDESRPCNNMFSPLHVKETKNMFSLLLLWGGGRGSILP